MVPEEAEAIVVEKEEIEEAGERYKTISPGVVEVPKVKLVAEGTELQAKIKKIRLGKVKDFIPIDRITDSEIRAYYEERAERPAINVELEIPELGITAEDTIIFSLHPNSRYVKLARRYGELEVGATVKVVNEAGKLKIV